MDRISELEKIIKANKNLSPLDVQNSIPGTSTIELALAFYYQQKYDIAKDLLDQHVDIYSSNLEMWIQERNYTFLEKFIKKSPSLIFSFLEKRPDLFLSLSESEQLDLINRSCSNFEDFCLVYKNTYLLSGLDIPPKICKVFLCSFFSSLQDKNDAEVLQQIADLSSKSKPFLSINFFRVFEKYPHPILALNLLKKANLNFGKRKLVIEYLFRKKRKNELLYLNATGKIKFSEKKRITKIFKPCKEIFDQKIPYKIKKFLIRCNYFSIEEINNILNSKNYIQKQEILVKKINEYGLNDNFYSILDTLDKYTQSKISSKLFQVNFNEGHKLFNRISDEDLSWLIENDSPSLYLVNLHEKEKIRILYLSKKIKKSLAFCLRFEKDFNSSIRDELKNPDIVDYLFQRGMIDNLSDKNKKEAYKTVLSKKPDRIKFLFWEAHFLGLQREISIILENKPFLCIDLIKSQKYAKEIESFYFKQLSASVITIDDFNQILSIKDKTPKILELIIKRGLYFAQYKRIEQCFSFNSAKDISDLAAMSVVSCKGISNSTKSKFLFEKQNIIKKYYKIDPQKIFRIFKKDPAHAILCPKIYESMASHEKNKIIAKLNSNEYQLLYFLKKISDNNKKLYELKSLSKKDVNKVVESISKLKIENNIYRIIFGIDISVLSLSVRSKLIKKMAVVPEYSLEFLTKNRNILTKKELVVLIKNYSVNQLKILLNLIDASSKNVADKIIYSLIISKNYYFIDQKLFLLNRKICEINEKKVLSFNYKIRLDTKILISSLIKEIMSLYNLRGFGYYNFYRNELTIDNGKVKKISKIKTNFEGVKESLISGFIGFAPNKMVPVFYSVKEGFLSLKPILDDESILNKNVFYRKKKDLLNEFNSIAKMDERRAFGLELEVASKISRPQIKNVLSENGVSVSLREDADSSGELKNWEIKKDFSINSYINEKDIDEIYNKDYEHQVELVSPLLYGDSGLKEATRSLREFYKLRKNFLIGKDAGTGLHVHHDAQWLCSVASKNKKIMDFINDFLFKIQEPLYSLCERHREDNEYCKKIEAVGAKTINRKRSGFNCFSQYGTIEFRMKEMTFNIHEIVRWIQITQLIVNNLEDTIKNKFLNEKINTDKIIKTITIEKAISGFQKNEDPACFLNSLNYAKILND